ncbi:hypothetical protein DM01DRAFT_1055948 [Hesseltinella vesiculosa]|uniref:Uncharacterized protein n=1 Tax=Hesseltinella vesiculosa TaxID=101127 RepID=A0A1X2GFW8_9FUNG|nr:hypothetical protein DM01DRAFT_1055948 [Hesseltinella vesiculosa]
MMSYLTLFFQTTKDMRELVQQPLDRTDDGRYDPSLHALVEEKMKRYGDNLRQDGLEWKALGLPVDMALLTLVKQWLLSACQLSLDPLDDLVAKINDFPLLTSKTLAMDQLLESLELTAMVVRFVGLSTTKIQAHCQLLCAEYGHWAAEKLEGMHQDQLLPAKPAAKRMLRLDLQLMHQLDGMIRIMQVLHTLQDHSAGDEPFTATSDLEDTSDTYTTVETIADMLVEVAVRAVTVIETFRQQKQDKPTKSANIMIKANLSSYYYMEEALLSFADKLIELAGRESIEGPKMQRLHTMLTDLEPFCSTDPP